MDARIIEKYRSGFLRLGIHKIAHLDEPLINHLARVYQILKQMGSQDYVCLAGLFHGSYGTQGFHTDEIGDIPESQRDIVRSCVGNASENLVYNFSVMSYDSIGKSLRNVFKPYGQPMLIDRRTGEIIHVSIEQFHELLAMKLADVLAHTPAQAHHTCLDLPEEYSSFWEMVAEYLGKNYLTVWHKIVKRN